MSFWSEATRSVDHGDGKKARAEGLGRTAEGRTSVGDSPSSSNHNATPTAFWFLSGGSMVEEGDHEALMAKDGVYANLYRLQYEKLEA
jgi:ATP-binding cassette subfamily B protein